MKTKSILPSSLAPFVLASALMSPASAATLVGFEAESGAFADPTDWVITTDTNALGGEYIYKPSGEEYNAPSDTETERIVAYSVTLEAGTYDLYARLKSSNNQLDNRVFVDFTFGTATSIWEKVDINTNLPNDGEYHWLNLSDLESRTMTATAGSQTFRIATRYDLMRIDAFALGTTGDTFTDAQLSAAVIPEPSVALLGGLGLLALLRRRR